MLKQLRPALMSVFVFTILTGFLFPLAVTAIAQLAFPEQARGSLIVENGRIIGSEIIGQAFSHPEYFHPRPSAAGGGYDATASGGTNLGPTSDKLIHGLHKTDAAGKPDPSNFAGIQDLATAYRVENGLPADTPVPADAVTRSASGLDPHISPENADRQVERIARSRNKNPMKVRRLVSQYTEGRTMGLIGEPRVNVLLLNRALDAAMPVVKR